MCQEDVGILIILRLRATGVSSIMCEALLDDAKTNMPVLKEKNAQYLFLSIFSNVFSVYLYFNV